MIIFEKLKNIQAELKAPKDQYNSFGKYNYRSCEDILLAVKPLLEKNDCALVLSDDVVEVGGRIYIKATAKLFDSEGDITNSAFAREASEKKGMDDSQITGTASSYARKYALNGLFCIDDTKDADTDEYKNQQDKNKKNSNAPQKQKADIPRITQEQGQSIKEWLPKAGMTEEKLVTAYKIKSLSQLPASEYPKIIKRLEEKAAQNGQHNTK